MNNFLTTMESYWQYLSVVAGLILVYLGFKIAFNSKFLGKLMGEDRIWEHKKGRLFNEKEAKNYNRGRGIQIALVGIIFIVFGIVSL